MAGTMIRSVARSLGPWLALGLAAVLTPSCGSSSSCTQLPCPPGVAWDSARCACGASEGGASEGGTADATTDGPSHDAGGDVGSDSPSDASPPADSSVDGPADGANDAPGDAPPETSIPEAGFDGSAKDGCLATGGTVGHALCCAGQPDFPNTCAVGACGCAPSASNNVQVCTCPAGKCFNGTQCQ
jgi:hypothetical protein